jgi:hypothetical protein
MIAAAMSLELHGCPIHVVLFEVERFGLSANSTSPSWAMSCGTRTCSRPGRTGGASRRGVPAGPRQPGARHRGRVAGVRALVVLRPVFWLSFTLDDYLSRGGNADRAMIIMRARPGGPAEIIVAGGAHPEATAPTGRRRASSSPT